MYTRLHVLMNKDRLTRASSRGNDGDPSVIRFIGFKGSVDGCLSQL